MTQRKAKFAIDRLKDIFDEVKPYLDDTSIKYIEGCIAFYDDAYDKELFLEENENRLRFMKWCPYNIRYGVHSVRGFTGEVLAAGLWNKNNLRTKLMLNEGDKKSELKGEDLVATNPNWARNYPVQVKTINDIKSFMVQDSWLGYPDNLNRFILADITHRQILAVDYQPFRRLCYQNEYLSLEEVLAKTHMHPLVMS